MCFWRVKYSENDLKNAGQRLHPEMWSKYLYDVQRAFLKAGSTHITWVPTEHLSNDKDILRIEADLTETSNESKSQPDTSCTPCTSSNRYQRHF